MGKQQVDENNNLFSKLAYFWRFLIGKTRNIHDG